MAIGLAEAIGQQGDLRLPTRSVAPTKSDIGKLLSGKQKQQQNLQEERQKIATKLLSYNEPVLPGDRERRKKMWTDLVVEMNERAARDPNWRPASDDDFVTKWSEAQVENTEMENLYKKVQQDIQWAARNKEKIVADEGDINFLDLTQDPTDDKIQYDENKFQEARSKYAQGSKWWDKNYMETNPWTEAIGPGKSFNVKNEDIAKTKGQYNIRTEGYNPAKDPNGVLFKKQLDDWIGSKNPDAKSLYQQAKAELVAANPSFDRKDEAAIKQRAFDIVYPYYTKKFPLTTSKILRSKLEINIGGGGKGSRTQEFRDGSYEFGGKTKVSGLGSGAELNQISYTPKKATTQTFTDLEGEDIPAGTVKSLFYDNNENLLGAEVTYRQSGRTETTIVPYKGKNVTSIGNQVPSLNEAYKNYSGSKKDIKTSETIKAGGADTRRFVPDFLNDAIKNIGDFLRPRAPEPPQPGGPDVTGMV